MPVERKESVLLHIRSVRVNWKSSRTAGEKTGMQRCVGWQCHFKCWYQNQILGIIWHIIAKRLKHILKTGMEEWLMCLTGGGDYDCVKLFMILKMLKCFGHSLQEQWLSPWQQEGIYLFPWQRAGGMLGRAVRSSSAPAPSSPPRSTGCGHIQVLWSCSWQGGVNWKCSCSLCKTD